MEADYQLFYIKLWMLLILPSAAAWIVPQPKQNIWVTLAKTLQQENWCLPMGSLDNLLSTCLVGIPLAANEYLYTGKKPNLEDTWDKWTKILLHAPEEPQELEFFGVLQSYILYCAILL